MSSVVSLPVLQGRAMLCLLCCMQGHLRESTI
jgi:hypothetical protein